jgi:uncharacterized protein YjbI with pentapeptide repeats
MPPTSSSDDRLTFEHAEVFGEDFSGFRGSLAVVGSRFERCLFERMRVDDASLGAGVEQSEYVDCSFDRSRLTPHGGGYSRFVRCCFRDVIIRSWDCYHVELVDCVFTGTLRSVRFWTRTPAEWRYIEYEDYVRFSLKEGRGQPPDSVRELMLRADNEFHGNDFSGANLIKADFRGGIDLSAQRLPSGDGYLYVPDAPDAIDRALALVDQRVPSELAPDVVRFLRDVLGREVEMGQHQLLLRDTDFASRKVVPPDIVAAFDLLRQVGAPPADPS